ncbi:MAG: dihydroorotate dehydrogenase [Methanosarcinaceae archaeon]|nr:dihydroorotate dehydrogenase [Methanosarcinaceae archaeon]
MYSVAGVELKNPTVLAAGVLGTTGASMLRVIENGAGGVVTKSVGPSPVFGHANPSMVALECGYINAMGLPNPSYLEFGAEIKKVKNGQKIGENSAVISSIFGGNAKEFVTVAKHLEKFKPDAFELNLSCPHAEGYGAAIGSNPCQVEEITKAVKDEVNIPVWVKLTPNVSDIGKIGKAAESGGADAVVAINTIKGMVIDIKSGWPVLGNRSGGLSGPMIKPIAVKCVYDLFETVSIPVIGVGGISNAEDAIEMILAGAAAVQIGSAVYDEISVFEKVNRGIEDYLNENGYSSVEEIIGLSHKLK